MPILPTAPQTVAGAETTTPATGASAGAAAEFVAVLDAVVDQAPVAAVSDEVVVAADETLPTDVDLTVDDDAVAVDIVPDSAKVEVPVEVIASPTESTDEAPLETTEVVPVDQPKPAETDEAPVVAPLVAPIAPHIPQQPPRASDPIRSVDDLLLPDEAKTEVVTAPGSATPPQAEHVLRAAPVMPANALAAATPFVNKLTPTKATVQEVSVPDVAKPEMVAPPVAAVAPIAEQASAARAPIAIPIDTPAPRPSAPRRDTLELPTAAPSAPPAVQASPTVLPTTAVTMVSPLAPAPVHDSPLVVDDAAVPEIERLSAEATVSSARAEQLSHPNIRTSITAPPFVRQIAVNIMEIGDGQTEIQLKPEELGRLRLSITSHTDTAVTVMMAAERGETADLLRRHIADLERDLMALGYTSIEFDFGNGAEAGHTPDDTPMTERGDTASDAPAPSGPTRRVTLNSGLDIRL